MMANISMEHVKTASDIPATMILGRLYFVEDTGIIVVNHGSYVAEYGGKAGKEELAEISAKMDCLYNLQALQWQANIELLNNIASTLNQILDTLKTADLGSADIASDDDVVEMIEGVMTGRLDDSDIDLDNITDMLDAVFAGQEMLDPGDADSEFLDMIEDVFATNESNPSDNDEG